jgi:serine/threonine protein kinase/tetratricopeptide (TPR) repeat protein
MLGTEFGKYRIVRRIGAGGMGEIYRAHDTQLDRDVALKILPTAYLPSIDASRRLLEEARSASALNHPNICVIYEAGDIDGRVFIAMEYIEGHELRDAIRPEGLPLETVVDYGVQMADAMVHAHTQGIVHRDLKASNIMITSEERIKLLDFGLATRTLSGRSAVNEVSTESSLASKTPAGTLPYVAPEVLAGGEADERSDIWSLGVIIFELALGRRPFTGRTQYELATAILHERPPSLSDPGLDLIIQRCLHKNPSRRYQRASELRAALETIQPAAKAASTVANISIRSHMWMLWVLGLCTVVLGLILLFLITRTAKPDNPASIRSLAVLPLTNLSSDSEQEYFADGMTDQLITQLGTIDALRVVSRTSVMHYKGTREGLAGIVKALHVDAVVQGSVLRAGDKVRITVQLTDAKSDRNLWAQSYERHIDDIVRLQGDVATAIAWQIRTKLSSTERARLSDAGTVNPEAYQLYLRGRYFWDRRNPEGFNKALALFHEAVEKDTSYARAYCGIADTYVLLQDYGLLLPDQAYPVARDAALKAVELDNTLAEAHTSLAGVLENYDRNWAGAEREYRLSIELNSNYVTAHQWYGTLLTILGRHDEAISEERLATDLAPVSARVNIDLGYALFHARQYAEAVEQAQKALELDPTLASGYELLGWAYLSENKGDEAIQQFQTAVTLTRNPLGSRALLAYAFAKSGRTKPALEILRELESVRVASAPYHHIAMIYVALGNYDKALTAVEQASRWQRDKWPQLLGVEEAFDPIRSQARFQAVLQHLHLKP